MSEQKASGQKHNEAAATTGTQPFRSKSAPLSDEAYREKVLEARKMSPEQKFLLGEELFNRECAIALTDIRSLNPGFSDEDCRRELERRLELQDLMDGRERQGKQGSQ